MNKFLILLIPFLFFACAKREIDPHQTDRGEDFFPLEVGKVRVYQVDSIIYGAAGVEDTLTSQIKEIIAEKIINDTDTLYRLVREWRRSKDNEWVSNTVWWVTNDNNRLIQAEENLKFIKLTFPVKEKTDWDGNAFFDDKTKLIVGEESMEFFKEWNYQIESIQPETINGENFAEVVTVQEANFETAIELRQSTAQYARGIGLVARSQKILDTQCITCTTPWEEKAEKGVILTQVLIEHN